jgi:hypothetical protein
VWHAASLYHCTPVTVCMIDCMRACMRSYVRSFVRSCMRAYMMSARSSFGRYGPVRCIQVPGFLSTRKVRRGHAQCCGRRAIGVYPQVRAFVSLTHLCAHAASICAVYATPTNGVGRGSL